jgi:hypothetical protein
MDLDLLPYAFRGERLRAQIPIYVGSAGIVHDHEGSSDHTIIVEEACAEDDMPLLPQLVDRGGVRGPGGIPSGDALLSRSIPSQHEEMHAPIIPADGSCVSTSIGAWT